MRRSEILAAESVECLNRALNRLKDIWEEIGIPEDQRLQRTDVVRKHIKGLLDMMIAEEDSLRKRLMSSIESCRKELEVLCTELQLSPFEEDEGRTMLQLEKDIRSRLEVMMKQKSQRVKELKTLSKQDRELCDIMCSVPFCIDMDTVPSLEQLDSYRSYLKDLTEEKDRRHGEFVGIKRQIIVCMEELDQLPDTSFERDVVCEDEEAFCLSNDNIAALQLLLGQLEDRKTENELVCNSYRGKIQDLWEKLQVHQEEREGMSDHMVQSRKKNMDALEAECRRLDELKMKNMENVLETIRAEVSLFWERCHYSLEQRRAFTPYYDVDLTVELLNLHEAELLSLKKHYEDHRELFEGVTRWQESWTLFLQLEKKATDPSRFNNRGGNLLREEKQRADLQKSLPKLEKSLKTQIDLWEEEQYREFLVNGQRFLQYVEEQWELLRLEKEGEKNERQRKKNRQIEHDLLYGTAQRTPSKRRLAGTPTPGKTRKLNATSSIYGSTPNSTLRSAFGGTLCQSPVLRLPMSASKLPLRTPSRVGRTPRTVERNKENISHLNGMALSGVLRNPAQSPVSHRNISINSVASTYSEFSRFLSKASKSVKTGHLNSTVTNLS
ncbi:protein regulator of cytokinesis 1-like isoform X1 [Salvelinus fontinalis]|uniref:protein regulator of cytokinesis 1-like isoform X1 n=1 Tax=Salvelinus fontinalis TaxID=8038 RepID=UPI0024854699|nr:protein regulator of cytokinesis 1-like isoform X1 [Salvelinus fontinalis]